MGNLDAANRRRNRKFKLGKKDIGRRDLVTGGFDFKDGQFTARSWYNHDRVLTGGVVDQDGSGPAGLFDVLKDVIKAHPLISIELTRQIAESVSTEFGDETNVRVEPGCRNGLIRALAARTHFKRLTQNSLTPFWHSR